MLRTTRLLVPCLAAGLLLASLAGAQSKKADVVVLRGSSGKSDTQKGVTISQDSYKGVKGRKGAQRFNWPLERVVSITYQRQPEAYEKGMAAYKEGNFRVAAQMFRKALESADRYPWMVVYGNWYAAEALRQLGYFDDADKHYQAIISKARESRLIPDVHLSLARMAVIRGKAEDARKSYKRLGDLAARAKLPDRYGSLAQLGMATVEARFGDAASGLAKLKNIRAGAPDQDVKNRCDLEIGQTYIRQKDFDKARTCFSTIQEQLDDEKPDVALIAGSSNGLGDCQWQLKQYAEAAKTYSRVYALFLNRADLRSEVAHALYWGGKAFEATSGLASDADQKKVLRRRALKLWRMAMNDFKGTEGSELARRQLGN